MTFKNLLGDDNLMDFLGGGWKKELGTEESFNEDYKKEHSLCCDAKIVNGICITCKEHSISQLEAGE